MPLYNINNNNLELIKKEKFSLEKDIQKLTENNLEKLFNLKFVTTEFQVSDLRIDTLAYNNEFNSFVIIEYKNTKNYSLIDQGYAYLSLLLNNKADFVLEYNEKFNANKNKKDFDFSQTKIMFISPSYSTYQLKSVNFKDLPFELWRFTKFSNNTILFDKIITNGQISINEIKNTNNKNLNKKINEELKIYDEDYHLSNKPDNIKELYSNFKESIQNEFEDIEVYSSKTYISFKCDDVTIVSVEPKANFIKLWFNMKKNTLNDYFEKTRDVSNIGHHGIGDYEAHIENNSEIPYLLELFKQTYNYKI